MRRSRPPTFEEFLQVYFGPQRSSQMLQSYGAQQYPSGAQRGQPGNAGLGAVIGGAAGGGSTASLPQLIEAYKAYQTLTSGAAPAATSAATTAATTAAPAAAQAAYSPGYAAMGVTPEVSASEAALSSAQAGPTVQNAALQGAGTSGTPLFDVGGPSYAGYAAAAYDAYKGYDNLTGSRLRDEDKATRAQQDIALAVADVYTGGLAGLAERALRGNKTTRKWLEYGDKLDKKFNPITIGINKFASDEWKKEGNRLRELEKKGVTIPEQLRGAMNLQRGRTKQQLVEQEKANIAAGKHGNVEFAKSRKESDLKPEDIWGYSAFFEKYGNDWLSGMSEAQRRQIAQRALDAGAVNEGKGTINVDWSKVNSDDIYKPKPTTVTKPTGNAGAKGQELVSSVIPKTKEEESKFFNWGTTPARKTPMTMPKKTLTEEQKKKYNLR